MYKLNSLGKTLMHKVIINLPIILMALVALSAFILDIQIKAFLKNPFIHVTKFDTIRSTFETIRVNNYMENGQILREINAKQANYQQEKWNLSQAEVIIFKKMLPKTLQIELFTADQAIIDSNLDSKILLTGNARFDRLETSAQFSGFNNRCELAFKECLSKPNDPLKYNYNLRVRADKIIFQPSINDN